MTHLYIHSRTSTISHTHTHALTPSPKAAPREWTLSGPRRGAGPALVALEGQSQRPQWKPTERGSKRSIKHARRTMRETFAPCLSFIVDATLAKRRRQGSMKANEAWWELGHGGHFGHNDRLRLVSGDAWRLTIHADPCGKGEH